MKKFILLSSLLCCFAATAQDYQWQWAKSGGGTDGATDQGFNELYDETIHDIIIDESNNYYFLSTIQQGAAKYENITVNNYGLSDILIISTDCEGNFRWSKTIGGSSQNDFSYKIGVDNNGGIYVAVNVQNNATVGSGLNPVHFSENDILPYNPSNDSGTYHDGYKRGFLLKYNTENGDLLWRKDFQGPVSSITGSMIVSSLMIDSINNIHIIVGLNKGTHLNNLVNVPEGEIHFYLVKYNDQGNIIGNPKRLPIAGSFGSAEKCFFKYDEALNRYYVGGTRLIGSTIVPLTYENIEFNTELAAYLFCFNGETLQEIWRKEISNQQNQFKSAILRNLEIDNNSDIYISGRYIIGEGNGASFGNFVLPASVGNYTSGNIPFILKTDSNGNVQWVTTPNGYTNSTSFTGIYDNLDLAINSSEIASLTNGSAHIWGNFQMTRPVNHRTDPVVLRLNKETGVPIGLHDIMTSGARDSALSSITVDNDGNYITGGYFYSDMFIGNQNNISPLSGSNPLESDFFMAKLAASVCGETVSNEEFSKSAIKLFPNPTSNRIFIESEESFRSYEVYNILGQNVAKGNFENNENSISLDGLSNGTYVIKLQTIQGIVFTEKVVKK